MRRLLVLILAISTLLALPAVSSGQVIDNGACHFGNGFVGFSLTGNCKMVNRDQEQGLCGKDLMASIGCGSAATANAVATLIHDPSVTPQVIAHRFCTPEFHPDGAGSWATLPGAVARHYDLVVHRLGNGRQAFRRAADVLRRGGYVIGLTHRHPIAVVGHYFGLRAVNARGQFLISDSNGNHGSLESDKHPWWPREMLNPGPKHPTGKSTQYDQLWSYEMP